jgi:predicted ATPase
MKAPGLTRLRLGRFKSYRGQQLSLEPLTLLVGRNGSGKSNALDALSLLALLADERDVGDLERGDQEVAGLRGGLSGAAPFGRKDVEVGCSVDSVEGGRIDLDLTLDSLSLEIVSERLTLRRGGSKPIVLLEARRQAAGAGISDVQVYSGGAPRTYHLLASRLATAQATTKVPEDSKARRLVVASANDMLAALRGVFVLDPVPAQMREYVRIGSAPDRAGASMSALAYSLRDDPESWARLLELTRGLVESEVQDITFSEGRLPDDRLIDVMVALVEKAGRKQFTAPARLMSDGTLRYLAIVASLLYLRGSKKPSLVPTGRTTLVVEEIENGLFPSQGARVLDLLRDEARSHGISLIATTHSPALLDALRPEDHTGVMVCDRSADGFSSLRRLTDHPRYIEIAGSGTVGRAVTHGLLESPPQRSLRSLADVFS